MDHRFHPTRKRWYVVDNDIIGGFAVSHVDKPLSEQDPTTGEGAIADFSSKAVAQHIADLHNAWADKARVDALLDGEPEPVSA